MLVVPYGLSPVAFCFAEYQFGHSCFGSVSVQRHLPELYSYLLPYSILFLSASINPVIYAASNSVFRGEFCKVAVLVENVEYCT